MLRRLISFCFLSLLLSAFALGCTPEPDIHTPSGALRTGGEGAGQIPLGHPDTFADVEEETPDDTSEPATDEGSPIEAECTPSLLVDCGT